MKLRDVVEFEFFQHAAEWLDGVRMVKAYQTYRNYKVVIDAAKKYQEHSGMVWDVEYLDHSFIDGFTKFLILDMRLQYSTLNKYLSILKLFLSDTYPGRDFSFVASTGLREKVVWIHSGELLLLKDIELDAPWDRIRDLFLFMATTGMRYVDTQRYDSDWLMDDEDNYVEYTQLQPGRASYTVLKGTPEEILKAYNGAPPVMEEASYVNGLRALLHNLDMVRQVSAWEEVKGKKVLLRKPLAFAVDKHTGRQTYIMQLLTNNVPIAKAMEYAGHYDYKTFTPYIIPSRRYVTEQLSRLQF